MFCALVSSSAMVVALAIAWPTERVGAAHRHQQRDAVAVGVGRQHIGIGLRFDRRRCRRSDGRLGITVHPASSASAAPTRKAPRHVCRSSLVTYHH